MSLAHCKVKATVGPEVESRMHIKTDAAKSVPYLGSLAGLLLINNHGSLVQLGAIGRTSLSALATSSPGPSTRSRGSVCAFRSSLQQGVSAVTTTTCRGFRTHSSS